MTALQRAACERENGQNDVAAVREYWNRSVDDWKIARHPAGTSEFFRETESYRFEKLAYLSGLIEEHVETGRKVLDVGCGLGNDLSRFARRGADVTGIDLSPRAIELAKTNFEQRGLQGRFEVMNGEAMSLPAESFDLVYCHTVLQFTPHPERMVREIRRVLRPGGLAIVMAINRKSWMNRMHRWLKVEIDHLDAPVFHRFTLPEFRRLLSPFARVDIAPQRFPVATKVHRGWKAAAYNRAFVGTFNALPAAITRSLGHHLIGYCRRQKAPG